MPTKTTSPRLTGKQFKLTAAKVSHDFLPSIVVFLVALPLCMGIAIASGVDPAAGLITGIVGGMIVGPLSGCPLQISGPAAGLAVIIIELIREHGIQHLGIIIVVAGVIQMLAGFSRCAQWFRATPPSVIHGMLSGIGVLIFASQFHVMVDDSPKESGIMNLISIPLALWKGLTISSELPHFSACMIGLLTISVLLGWNTLKEKTSVKLFKTLPGSLLAIILATAASYYLNLNIKYVSLPDNFAESFRFIDFSLVPGFISWELLFDGFAVAFVAAAETLLTATAVDKMHKGERTNYDRELVAQGAGNMICGFIGGLAMTGVMVRSGVNVAAGAKTSELYIYFATIGAIVCIDLLTGVLIGVALSIFKLLYIFAHLEIRVADDFERNRTDVFLKGSASFLSLPRFAEALERVRPETELHVHLDALDYVDHACLDLIMSWEEKHVAGGGHLVIDWGSLEAAFGSPTQEGVSDQSKSSPSRKTRPLAKTRILPKDDPERKPKPKN